MSKKFDQDLIKLDFYEILELKIEAEENVIRKSYRKKALKCHPDKNPDDPEAAQEFDRLQKILEILLDPGARSAYDKVLKARKAAEIRNREDDAKCRKLREDLEAREAKAQAESKVSLSDQERLRRELARLEKQNQKVIDEEIEKLNKKRQETLQKIVEIQNQKKAEPEPPKIVRVKAKWKDVTYTEEELHELFYKWGDIEAIAFIQKDNKGSALIEFKERKAADSSRWKESICISVDNEDEMSSPRSVEDTLHEMFKDQEENTVHIGRFLGALMESGLRRSDPRLEQLNKNLLEAQADQSNPMGISVASLKLDENTFRKNRRSSGSGNSSPSRSPYRSPRRHTMTPINAYENLIPVESMMLPEKQFKQVIRDNIVLIASALQDKLVIPNWAEFCSHIEMFYDECSDLDGGNVAKYIPQLAKYDPNLFGISICTTSGQRFSVGDTNVPFTIQSCSKPITYAIALNELGSEVVHKYVGQEPSGRMFNAIVLDYNNQPHNPLVNAGSIVINGLLHSLVKPEMPSSEKFDFVQDYFRRLSGYENIGFSNGTFLSEREHADRNYALAYYMRENKCFPEKCDLRASLDLYFQSCSMEVTAESASVIAATMANGGICPTTGEKILEAHAVRDVLSLMHSCGMYDYSGQFAFKVGLPAKSGVCGAIMLVIPNVMGVCVWSPPLDSLGNSVRGTRFCERIVEVFNFHRYDNLRHAANKKDPRRQKYDSQSRKVVSVFFSAAAGDVSALRRAALAGMNMEEKDYDGRTALHLAAVEGHFEAVKFLIEKCKVCPSPKDRWDRRPIDDAEHFNQTHLIDYLKEKMKIFDQKKQQSIEEENENSD